MKTFEDTLGLFADQPRFEKVVLAEGREDFHIPRVQAAPLACHSIVAGFGIQHGSRNYFLDPESWILDPESWILNPGS